RIRDSYRPPDSVYEAVERTLDRLDPKHLQVLRVAAQIDRQFLLSDVEALGLFEASEPRAALEAARADRLCTVEGDRWTFSHDTIREELAVRSEGLDLSQIHRRIATRLDERGAS